MQPAVIRHLHRRILRLGWMPEVLYPSFTIYAMVSSTGYESREFDQNLLFALIIEGVLMPWSSLEDLLPLACLPASASI